MKRTYRQSSIVNYFDCPRKFLFSQTIPFVRSKQMVEGNLFEGLVFGFKQQHVDEFGIPLDTTIDTVTPKPFGVLAPTLESFKRSALFVKPLFLDGEPYFKLSHEASNWILTGEADFIGDIIYKEEKFRCIADLKFTGDIDKIWGDKEATAKGFFQSIVYPYLHYKNTGELLPFVYIVVENNKSLPEGVSPLIKTFYYSPTVDDFEKLEQFIDKIDNDFENAPNLNSCVTGPYWNYECPYLLRCKHGRALKETPVIIPSLEWN